MLLHLPHLGIPALFQTEVRYWCRAYTSFASGNFYCFNDLGCLSACFSSSRELFIVCRNWYILITFNSKTCSSDLFYIIEKILFRLLAEHSAFRMVIAKHLLLFENIQTKVVIRFVVTSKAKITIFACLIIFLEVSEVYTHTGGPADETFQSLSAHTSILQFAPRNKRRPPQMRGCFSPPNIKI